MLRARLVLASVLRGWPKSGPRLCTTTLGCSDIIHYLCLLDLLLLQQTEEEKTKVLLLLGTSVYVAAICCCVAFNFLCFVVLQLFVLLLGVVFFVSDGLKLFVKLLFVVCAADAVILLIPNIYIGQ